MKTPSAVCGEVEQKWYLVDATGLVLGRLATKIATVLRGKHKAQYTPHIDTGDYVVVVNASKLLLTGDKLDAKLYHHYSGHPGGLRSRTARDLLATDPERVLREAVKGMLPKNRLAGSIIKKLKVYGGPEHLHQAQQPEPLPESI
jgi:large subunit ribosomal protein L13